MAYKVALYDLTLSQLATFNDSVTAFQKEFHAHMKAHGYERDARIQSAQYHWTYIKGNHRVTINGWHGSGKPGTSRFYGAAKSLNNLYDNKNNPAYKAIVDVEGTADTHAELIAAQMKGMKEALEYIRRTVK